MTRYYSPAFFGITIFSIMLSLWAGFWWAIDQKESVYADALLRIDAELTAEKAARAVAENAKTVAEAEAEKLRADLADQRRIDLELWDQNQRQGEIIERQREQLKAAKKAVDDLRQTPSPFSEDGLTTASRPTYVWTTF